MITSGSSAYRIDDDRKQIVKPDGSRVRVHPRTYELLRFLHENKGRPFTSIELLSFVWGRYYKTNNLHVAMSELRQKAGQDIIDHDAPYYGVGIR